MVPSRPCSRSKSEMEYLMRGLPVALSRKTEPVSRSRTREMKEARRGYLSRKSLKSSPERQG